MRSLILRPSLLRATPTRMLFPVAPDDLVSLPAMVLAAAGSGGGAPEMLLRRCHALLTRSSLPGDPTGALSSTADELAGSLFGASLFPWLAMLYWMAHPKVRAFHFNPQRDACSIKPGALCLFLLRLARRRA